jgi:cysteine desulfurase
MYANNEIGTIQPIGKIGKLVARVNRHRLGKKLPPVFFHTDACQAAGFCELNVNNLGADLVSVNGSKIYGPKQSGFLFVRKGTKISPIIYGGGQEGNLRSGTENVANAVGLAKAFQLAQKDRNNFSKEMQSLRDVFIENILKNVPHAELNGPKKDLQSRLPNNLNFTFKDIDAEALMYYLDAKGVCVSTGSACSTKEPGASHVLLAIGRNESQATNSIRITLGKGLKREEIKRAVKIILETLDFLKSSAK